MFDYIIIGAGSGGCVLAHRLSANRSNRVLLLEAGGPDRSPYIHMPGGLAKLVNDQSLNWDYYTEPQSHLEDRRLWWPRGKVLGGSSSINAMCYVRGQPDDYDGWAELGLQGWRFSDVLPYFKRSENQQHGASEYHGADGPLYVQDLRYRSPLSEAFVEGGRQCALPASFDFNGPTQEGIGFYQVTQRDGRRCSAATAYLRPAQARDNLEIQTGARVQRLVLDGERVAGVEYSRGAQTQRAEASREVLLCAGAVNSPQVLMLSGIGPADHVRSHGIATAVDLPGVGGNLHDHLDICVLYGSDSRHTYDMGPIREAWVGLRYLFGRRGPGTTNVAEAGGFIRSRLAVDDRPDVQVHFVPALLDDHGRNRLPGRGFTLHACPLRPKSRGHVRLDTADPAKPPLIQPNYLDEQSDLELMLECVRIARKLLRAEALAPYRGHEIFPGARLNSETELIGFIRRKAETIYHPAGTCRMGTDDGGVVDAELRVRGVEGLRVVDASVMPTLVSGNTNAPVIMMAEKAADMILGQGSVANT